MCLYQDNGRKKFLSSLANTHPVYQLEKEKKSLNWEPSFLSAVKMYQTAVILKLEIPREKKTKKTN
jgi:hypothetical protein